jgi:hypothetical protein
MAITITSLISNLLPGGAALIGSLPVKGRAGRAQQEVLSRGAEPWRNQADDQPLSIYTRKDANGQRLGVPTSSSTTVQPSTETNPVASKLSPSEKNQTSPDSAQKPPDELLSKSEMALLRELQKADRAVKAHEMAHLAAAGGYAKGGASFSYQRGPDGQNYAVGGEVKVDTSKEATPAAMIKKMQIIRQAALAPADPSPQDQLVAAHATLQIAESSRDLQRAQAVQALQPTTSDSPAQDTTTITEGVSSVIDQSHGVVGVATSTAKSPKKYGAYLTTISPLNRSERQVVSRIA